MSGKMIEQEIEGERLLIAKVIRQGSTFFFALGARRNIVGIDDFVLLKKYIVGEDVLLKEQNKRL